MLFFIELKSYSVLQPDPYLTQHFFPDINKPQASSLGQKKRKIGMLELFYDSPFPPVSSYILKIEMGLAAAI